MSWFPVINLYWKRASGQELKVKERPVLLLFYKKNHFTIHLISMTTKKDSVGF